jgi:hypothetical protein
MTELLAGTAEKPVSLLLYANKIFVILRHAIREAENTVWVSFPRL